MPGMPKTPQMIDVSGFSEKTIPKGSKNLLDNSMVKKPKTQLVKNFKNHFTGFIKILHKT